jgi:hypothetical protein
MRRITLEIAYTKNMSRFNLNIYCVPDDVRVNVTGRAELSPKNERGNSYLKLVEIKFKGFIGDAIGRLVDTTNNPENKIFGEFPSPSITFNKLYPKRFFLFSIAYYKFKLYSLHTNVEYNIMFNLYTSRVLNKVSKSSTSGLLKNNI